MDWWFGEKREEVGELCENINREIHTGITAIVASAIVNCRSANPCVIRCEPASWGRSRRIRHLAESFCSIDSAIKQEDKKCGRS
jgi:hypothetical protein